MNSPRLILTASITALLALSAVPSVQAATQYWNPGGTGTITTVTAGSGTWDTTTPNWTDATTATTAGATFVSGITGSIAVFAGTGATPSTSVNTNAGADATAESLVVTLGSSITTGPNGTGGIFFNNTGFLLTSSAAQTITDPGNVTVATGKSASIGGSLTLDLTNPNSSPSVLLGNGSVFNINTGATLTKASGGTTRGLLLTTSAAGTSGTFNIAGAVSFNISNATTGALVIGQTNGTTTVNVNNGGLLTSNSIGAAGIGSITLGNAGATAILNVTAGGSVSATNTASAFAGIEVGRVAGGSGTVNLNGGTITTPRVFKAAVATGTFNFNGGTLTANVTNNTDFMTGLTRANVRDGGAVIDTAGFDVTIGQNLLPSNVTGDAGTGGVSKNNAGVLALSGANSYNGATTINGGTLLVSGSISGSTALNVNNGGTLLLGGVGTDRFSNTAAVNLAGGTLDLNGLSEGGGGGSPSATTNGVGLLTLSANSTIDFAIGATTSYFQFSSVAQSVNGTVLAITNWDGLAAGGGTERLLFSGASTEFTDLFNQNEVSFNGTPGYAAIGFTGGYEIVPIPEPSIWMMGTFLLGLVGFRERRRLVHRN